MSRPPLLEAINITKKYGDGDGEIKVLTDVQLSMAPGEMIGIVGVSGSGKTTLLQVLGTLDSPSSGEILFNGENLLAKNDNQLADFRNRSLGFIFQFHHLLPEFTALENVMMPALINGKLRKEMVEPARELLAQVELDHRTTHKINELSGGEQQRTALARALIMKPALLLADEPTGNLDNRAGNLVFDLLRKLCREYSLATLMVTHNLELADRLDRCLTLENGVLHESS